MRVVRGRAGTIASDRAVSQSLLEDTRETGEPTVRVWTPHRQVAFGRRDARSEGYDAARAAANQRGFPPFERDVGGRAVAYTGSTVAFARTEPTADARTGIAARYDRATAAVARALAAVGVEAAEGEPPNAFCPGTHSLSAGPDHRDGKVVGLAQRVQQGVALVAGVCVVADDDEIGAVLEPVYGALGVPFDPDSVGSVARAGGDADPGAVCRALEWELAGDTYDVEYLSG